MMSMITCPYCEHKVMIPEMSIEREHAKQRVKLKRRIRRLEILCQRALEKCPFPVGASLLKEELEEALK